MNPNLFPYNNLSLPELLAEAERTDNKLALAIAAAMEDAAAEPDAATVAALEERAEEAEECIRRAIAVLRGY